METAYAPPSPWTNRWSEPSPQQLLNLLQEQHQTGFTTLIEKLDTDEHVRQSLVWYGQTWHWTIKYDLLNEAGNELGILCYVVPNDTNPLVCITLERSVIEALPTKRLGRFLNDGIRSAKCAITIHWAKWTPNTMTEVDLLLDLLKRKAKIVRAAAASA